MSATFHREEAGPLVSVVTPFYNTADHLDECIASVVGQSMADFEYILQDNASTDGSGEIARRWAERDPRIRYHRLDTLIPQVPNYNLALTRIAPASRYCKIVQADDWIDADCLRRMVELADRHPRVGIVSSYRLRGDTLHGEGLPYRQTVVAGRDLARLQLLSSCYVMGSPTTVMFRSDVVRRRQPFYAEGRLHEDTEACYEILREWDFGFVHQVLSFSRVDPGSTYGRMRSFDSEILDKLIVFHRYGREVLSGEEFERRREEIEGRYHRRLARAALEARPADYWRFQRKGRGTQGIALRWPALARAMLRELAAIVTCPHQIVQLLSAWTHRRAS